MDIYSRRAFVGSLCLMGAASSTAWRPSIAVQAPTASASQFKIFDALLYSPMPDLRALGMLKLLDAGNVWRPNIPHGEVDPPGVEAAVRFIRTLTKNYYFDLEEWPISAAPQPVIDATIHRYEQVAEIARRFSPDLKFGFYDVAPQGTYWPIVLKNSVGQAALAQWKEVNRRSAVIAAKVDYLFPSLYTFYNDPAGWEQSARAVLTEARQYGKPVYPFLWPSFHNSNAALRGTKVPGDFWRRQLEVCREEADGLVLWGGYKELWDDQADWWLETQSFMRQSHLQPG